MVESDSLPPPCKGFSLGLEAAARDTIIIAWNRCIAIDKQLELLIAQLFFVIWGSIMVKMDVQVDLSAMLN